MGEARDVPVRARRPGVSGLARAARYVGTMRRLQADTGVFCTPQTWYKVR